MCDPHCLHVQKKKYLEHYGCKLNGFDNDTLFSMHLRTPLAPPWNVPHVASAYISHRAFRLSSVITDRTVMARFLAFSSFRDFLTPSIRSLVVKKEETTSKPFHTYIGMAMTRRCRLSKYQSNFLQL